MLDNTPTRLTPPPTVPHDIGSFEERCCDCCGEELTDAGCPACPREKCPLCHGARRVCIEHEPGEAWCFVPAWGYESGQRDCPECMGEEK